MARNCHHPSFVQRWDQDAGAFMVVHFQVLSNQESVAKQFLSTMRTQAEKTTLLKPGESLAYMQADVLISSGHNQSQPAFGPHRR